jgi:hypothetical protein
LYLIERIVLGSVGLISFISLWFIPKQKIREATFIYLFTQFITWGVGLYVVERGWIEYPVRFLFNKANSTSFFYEYVVLPLLCAHFNLRYPEAQGWGIKIGYYTAFLSVSIAVEYLIEMNTLLIKFIHWEWYTSLFSLALLIYLVRVAYKSFYRYPRPFKL